MKLLELAKVIRSKNAGPTTLTIDIMFNDETGYKRAIIAPSLAPAAVAVLYGVRQDQVNVIPYAPAFAVKIVMQRRIVAGTPGDTDVYGAQQHGPLLAIDV